LRDECLNRELFGSLREARIILESWRVEYNVVRPHSALGYRTPNQYAQALANQFDGGLRAPKPRAARRGRRSGELINATRWRTNKKQNIKKPAELQL
jgi:Integrase core domain